MALPTAATPGYGYYYTYTSHPDVACNCLREWLPKLAKMARHRGILGANENLRVIQCTGGAAASAGTHSRGGAFDLAMPDPTRWNSKRTFRVLGPKTNALIYLSREMGGLDWARFDVDGRADGDAWENNEHLHGLLNGCPHLPKVALDQIAEYKRGEDGLTGSGRDPHPRPSVLRTWKQGIAWADAQMNPSTKTEDDMQQSDVQDIWTGYAVVKNMLAANPDTAPRVTPSNQLEACVRLSKAALDKVNSLETSMWRKDIIPAPDASTSNPTWQPDSYLREIFKQARDAKQTAEQLAKDVAALRALIESKL